MPVISTIAAATTRAFGAFKSAAGGAADEFFKYVTLLLHGDGTNGAQNNTFLDSSTNNFTITRNGNTTQGTFSPFSQTGWSNYFDGSGDTLSVASSSALSMGTGDFTVDIWIYPTALGAVSTLLDNSWDSGSAAWQIGLSSGNVVQVYNANGAGSNLLVQTTATISANTWTLISVVKSGTTVTIYLNGTSSASGTMNATFGRDAINYIGSQTASTNYFTGYISNLRVVKGTAVYTGNFTPPTTPLTAISGTSLLTCQSNRFVDNSSNAFAITVNGNTSVQAFSPFAPTAAYSAATVGGSGYFDGSGDYLSSSGGDLGSGNFTLEFWAYPTSLYDYINFIATRDSSAGSAGSWYIGTQAAGALVFGTSGPTETIRSANGVVKTNTWSHFAFVRNGSTVTAYVNGASVGSATYTTNLTLSTVYTGSFAGGGEPYTGYLSSVRIVKGTAVYTANFTPPTAPLTAISGTSLLCNFTNGGIIDNTAKNVLETVGNAQISTSVKKFGTGSLAFDGTGDVLISPASQNYSFGTGDFTIEGWINWAAVPNSGSTYAYFFAIGGNTTNGLALYVQNGVIKIWNGSGVLSCSTVLSTGTFYHVAIVRSSGTLKVYLNGTQDGSVAFTSNITSGALNIGQWANISDPTYFNGYIDDLRITKGIARYTTTFTPPTAAFADQ